MEDTKALLVMVLQKIFHDRPKIVEDTYQLIYSYNNGKKEMSEYERTLKNICDMMNDELPSEILVYLLTLVDMPHEDGHQLPIMEKIQRTYGCLAESVRPSLLEYLGRNKLRKTDEKIVNKEDKSNVTEEENIKTQPSKNTEMFVTANESSCCYVQSGSEISPPSSTSDSSPEDTFLKPVAKQNRKRKICRNPALEFEEDTASVKSLLDITAKYVIRNEKKLKSLYKTRLSEAWKVINSDRSGGAILMPCYTALQDINKKAKLLRCIENDNVTEEILMEEYGNSDILLKERNMYHKLNKDPFELSDELKAGLKSIIDYIK